MLRHKFFLLLIIFIASALRLFQLGMVPSGITNDEAGIIYSAYSIAKTHTDILGNFLPLSFQIDNSFSPTYIYITAPFVNTLGISPFSGRLPFAIMGILSVLLLYLIANEVFHNKSIALLSSLVLAISPWHIQITRAAYDAPVAMFFFLLGIYIFIIRSNKGNITWSLPFFFLGFYSYHATKVLFIPLILLLIFFYKDMLLKRKKGLIFFSLGIVFTLVSFVYVTKTQKVTRQEIFLGSTSDLKKAADMVNWERKINNAPFFIQQLFSNKPLYYLRVIRENYLESFSPHFLFLYGEVGGLAGIYGTLFRGTMYIIELPLLFLGFAFLIKKKEKNISYLLLSLLLIAPFPSALTFDKSFVMRNSMMLPFLSIIVGCGIYYFFHLLRKQKRIISFFIITIFLLIYGFLVTEYIYQYYFRYSIYGAESWFTSNRDLSIYIEKNKSKYQNIIVITKGNMFLLQYGVYNKTNPKIIQSIWNRQGSKQIENVLFADGCIDTHGEIFNPKKYLKSSTLYIVPDECHKNTLPSDTIKDLGEPLRTIWKIYINE